MSKMSAYSAVWHTPTPPPRAKRLIRRRTQARLHTAARAQLPLPLTTEQTDAIGRSAAALVVLELGGHHLLQASCLHVFTPLEGGGGRTPEYCHLLWRGGTAALWVIDEEWGECRDCGEFYARA